MENHLKMSTERDPSVGTGGALSGADPLSLAPCGEFIWEE